MGLGAVTVAGGQAVAALFWLFANKLENKKSLKTIARIPEPGYA
jgi:hypothetical protein